jgi:Rrf2 family protein
MSKSSSRFVVAVHVVTLLAHEEGRSLTSDYIAGSVNTNPVVIRRVLRLLAKSGVVRSAEGSGGGTSLARRANEITLADVFHVIEEGEMIGVPRKDPNPLCPVGRCVQTILGGHLGRFQKAFEREMKKVTVADILTEVRAAGRR